MGKGRRGAKQKARTMKRDFREARPDEWQQDNRKPKPDGSGYEDLVTTNAAFEEYYQKQGIVPEGEWEDFLEALRKPLPTTFRINGTGKFAADLRDRLDNDFFARLRQEPMEVDGEKLEEPRAIPWYPNKLAWQLTYSRSQLRKLEALAAVHELLKRENSAGGISRQEAVSMIPPLFLDIEPHHKVLDTCASPGSKTAQVVEMLHEGGPLPAGFCIANDSDAQRCNLLVHQTRRMNSPALLVTNHDASGYPLVCRRGAPKEEAVRFDRILCDVPCSGDGTMRKAPDIWRRWNMANGIGLHALQVRITLHSATLLKVGGRLVYSTCSFNPVEDEAVVAEVLRQSGGALELVDESPRLPELQRVQGLQAWSLKAKGSWFSSFPEAEQAGLAANFSPSMFPDPQSGGFPLARCMRLLPHHGDTGGFFVAVFRKVTEVPASLQPDRWKRGRDRVQDRPPQQPHGQMSNQQEQGVAPLMANGAASAALQAENGAPEEAQDAAMPLARGPAPAERNTAEQPIEAEDAAFGDEMGQRADDAAQAAVTFADAVADEDVHAATEAAEEAAEAAEDVADFAEQRPPSGQHLEPEASVGSRPKATTDNEDVCQPSSSAANGPAAAAATDQWGSFGQQKGGPGTKRPRYRSGDEPLEPFTDAGALDRISTFYGFDAAFPLRQHLVTRIGTTNQTGARKLYFISPGVKEVLVKDEARALKVTTAGLKVFERNDKKQDPNALGSPFRIAQEGLPLLLPHLSKQLLRPTAAELLRMLKERSVVMPRTQQLPEPEASGAAAAAEPPQKKARLEPQADQEPTTRQEAPEPADAAQEQPVEAQQPVKDEPPQAAGARIEPQGEARKIPLSDLETLRQIGDIRGGCCICTLRVEEARQLGLDALEDASGVVGAAPIAAVCWRGRASISLLVDKNEAAQMAEKLEAAIQGFAASHAPTAAFADAS